MKTTELNKLAFKYILDAIMDIEDIKNEYDVSVLDTQKDKINWVYDCFKSEYWYKANQLYYRGNEIEGFKNWLMGLPSAINIEFMNYRIIEIAKEWGSIPQDATEKQEDKIIENWFNFIANKFFQLKKRVEKKDIVL